MSVFTRKKRQNESIAEYHFSRIKNEFPLLTRDEEFNMHSYNHLLTLTENADMQIVLKTIETFLDDQRRAKHIGTSFGEIIHGKEFMGKQFKINDSDINFLDLIPKAIEQKHPDTYNSTRDIFKKGVRPILKDTDLESGVHYQPARIEKLLDARDQIFGTIKLKINTEPISEIIDISDVSYLAYASRNGVLSYCQTINTPGYPLVKGCDDAFDDALDKGYFRSDKSLNTIFLYSGAGFIENSWAERMGVRNEEGLLVDMSGLDLHYLFGGRYRKHKTDSVTNDNLYAFMMEQYDAEKSNILIKNNSLQNQDISDTMDEMEILRLLSKDYKIFYTLPISSNNIDTSSHYGSNTCSFTKNFLEEFLLSGQEIFRIISEERKTLYGTDIYVGFCAKNDVELINQYRNDSIPIAKGTKIFFTKSSRFNDLALDMMQDLSGLQVSQTFNDSVKYLSNR